MFLYPFFLMSKLLLIPLLGVADKLIGLKALPQQALEALKNRIVCYTPTTG